MDPLTTVKKNWPNCPLVYVTEMVEAMKTVASQGSELSVEERNLLSVAYKNVIGARRASWRYIHSLEQKAESTKVDMIKTYRLQVHLFIPPSPPPSF